MSSTVIKFDRVVENTVTWPVVKRFYRPELDALRCIAFLAVFIHHGAKDTYGMTILGAVGGFGLPIFFFLSAYLITELLLREREETGTVKWRLFFIRRALRIWPLYYTAVGVAAFVSSLIFVTCKLRPSFKLTPVLHALTMAPGPTVAMLLFLTNWVTVVSKLSLLVSPLWSISVEEQFYLLWPPLVKWGGERAILISSLILTIVAGVWIGHFRTRGVSLWYDTPVQFLYFAAGAAVAIIMRSRPLPSLGTASRVCLWMASGCVFTFSALISGVGEDNVSKMTTNHLFIGYFGGAIGCIILFIAFLGIKNIPKVLVELGKKSYGLYVYHLGVIAAAQVFFSKRGIQIGTGTLHSLIVDSTALVVTILLAHLSYKLLEYPFLRLKLKYTVILSRPD